MPELPVGVALLVVASAALHAAWNALVKASDDKLRVMTAVTVSYGAMAWLALPWTGLPDRASWPYLLGSATVHQVYRVGLARMYERGDLGKVYPIARGLAPVAVSLIMAGLGEVPGPGQIAALALVAAGLVSLGGSGGAGRDVGAAVWVAATITAYTLLDGLGARRSGAPVAYTMALAALDATVFGLRMLRRGGLVWLRGAPWGRAFGGGLMSLLAYAVALFAATQGAVGVMAALRETSVVFAAVLGRLLFGEPFGASRVAASVAVALGLVLLQAL